MKSAVAIWLAAVSAAISVRAESERIEIRPGAVEVLIAPTASLVTRFAAKELSRYLGETFNAVVPVVTSRTDGSLAIALDGRTSGLPRDGFRLTISREGVVIAGRDDEQADIEKLIVSPKAANLKFERGTLFGVYEFLERCAGVRFYFPGELGTCVQKKSMLRLPCGSVVRSPAFIVRHYYQRGDGDWPAETDDRYGTNSAENVNWLRTRMQTRRLAACHGQNGYRITERFRETHPEFLQLRKDGTREDRVPDAATRDGNQGWRYRHLCQSEVWTQFRRDVLTYLENGRRPPEGLGTEAFGGFFLDVMPQDGYKECHCPKCQAAYDKTVRDYASELIWSQTAEFARWLKTVAPDLQVTQNAYFPYGAVPKCEIPDNVRVMVAKDGPWLIRQPGNLEEQLAAVREWTEKLGGGRSVWLWTYPGKYGALNVPLLPQMSPRAYAEYYGAMMPMIFGAFAESDSDRAIFNYLNYYVFGKLAWNGHIDIEAVLEEHHRRMFGPAAPEMQCFYDELEECFLKGVMGRDDGVAMGPIGPMPNPPCELILWTQVYGPDRIAKWRRLFNEALAKVSENSLEARRLKFIRREFLDGLAAKSEAARRSYSVEAELARRERDRPRNLIGNGDFKTLEDWEISGPGRVTLDHATYVSPSGALRLEATDASMDGPYVRASAKYMLDQGERRLKPNTRYRISCLVKCENVKGLKRDAGVSLCFHDNIDRALPERFITGTTDWVQLSTEFVSKKNTNIGSLAFVQPRITNATGTAWFDDLLIEELP